MNSKAPHDRNQEGVPPNKGEATNPASPHSPEGHAAARIMPPADAERRLQKSEGTNPYKGLDHPRSKNEASHPDSGKASHVQQTEGASPNFFGPTAPSDAPSTVSDRTSQNKVPHQSQVGVTPVDSAAAHNSNFGHQRDVDPDLSVSRFIELGTGPQGVMRGGPSEATLMAARAANKEQLHARSKRIGRDPAQNSTLADTGYYRSDVTNTAYLVRGQQLIRRYRKQAGLGTQSIDNLDPQNFVNWLLSYKATLSSSTWRTYRQAARSIIATIPNDKSHMAIAMLDNDKNDASHFRAAPAGVKPGAYIDELGARKVVRRTSALKSKRFPKADFDKVYNYLTYCSRSYLAEILADWMIAGVTTGLRPIEWQATDVEVIDDPDAPHGRRIWLYVLNAKATNNRANGVVRTIEISSFQDETISAIKRMSEIGLRWFVDGEYHQYQTQCAQLLYRTCDLLFPNRKAIYALYSLRHQFVANAKSLQTAPAVSAMCGHLVTDTAIANYGRKTSSWGPEQIVDRAEPVPEEVFNVRQQHKFYEQRARIQAALGLNK